MSALGGRVVSLDVTAETVCIGDWITIGGVRFLAVDVQAIGGLNERKLLRFRTGETLVMLPHTKLAATRVEDERRRQR